MSKRNPYYDRVTCAEPGCMEVANYRYDTRAEYKEGIQWRLKHPYRCSRHSQPDTVLSQANPIRETVMELKESNFDNLKGDLFWDGKNGLIYGPGFKAFAKDFPVGTKLIITAKIELP